MLTLNIFPPQVEYPTLFVRVVPGDIQGFQHKGRAEWRRFQLDSCQCDFQSPAKPPVLRAGGTTIQFRANCSPDVTVGVHTDTEKRLTPRLGAAVLVRAHG